MEDSNIEQHSHKEKYSFISLYLFILIFFVIIHQLVEEAADSNKINRFINKLAHYDGNETSATQDNKKLDSSAIYYSKKVEAYLPAEVSQIKSINIAKSKKLEWDEVFEYGRIKDSFKQKIEEIATYIRNSDVDSIMTFLVSARDTNKALAGLTLLASYSAEIEDINIIVEFEKPQSEDLVRILVSNK